MIKKKIRRILTLLGLQFRATQYEWGRKLYGGNWYLIYNWLPMNIFWSNKLITSCGGRALETEQYEHN